MGRLTRLLGGLVLLLALLGVGGFAALAWRLSAGPLDVAWLARRIEGQINQDSPTRLQIGHAAVRWLGFQQGAGRGLELQLRDIKVVNTSGAPGAELAEADISVSLRRLLALQAAPRNVELTGLRLRVLRGATGEVTLDLGGLMGAEGDGGVAPDAQAGQTLTRTIIELRRPAGGDHSAESALDVLAQMRRLTLRNAVIEVVDRQLDTTAQVTVASLELERQDGGGVRGAAEGRVALGSAVAALHLQADLAAAGGTRMQVTMAPVAMEALAQSSPALAPLAAMDAMLQGTASLELSPALRPRSAELRATTASGRLRLRGAEVPFQSLSLEATAGWEDRNLRPQRVGIQRAQAVLPSPRGAWSTTVGASGQAARVDGKVRGAFEVTVDHLALADLPGMWPAAWAGHARPWITENLTAGTARDGVLRVSIEAMEDFSAPKLTGATGSLLGEDVTIHWLRPVPPVDRAQAVVTVVNPDVIEIAVPTGRQGAMTLRDGTIRIWGMSVKDQFMALSADVAGPVADAVTLLRHPRLRLLDRKPISFRNPGGTLTGKLSVDLPLEHHLEFEQVKIRAQGHLAAFRAGALVAGRDLDRGEIDFDANTDALKASGSAAIAGIPASVSLDMDFRGGPPAQVVQRAAASGRASARQLAGLGLDPGGLMPSGQAAFEVAYSQRRDGQGELRVKADLREAGLAVAGWQKAPGQPADAAVRLVLRNDKLVGIEDMQARGPGLQMQGRVELVGDRPLILQLDRLVLGATQAAGEVRFPERRGEPIRANLSGPVLDLSAQFSRKTSSPSSAAAERDPPWVADVRFDKVLMADQHGISSVTAHAEHDGRRLRSLRAESAGPERVRLDITPQGSGRQISLQAADAGTLLRSLDVTQSMQGGKLTLQARYDDAQASPPLTGTAELTDFNLRDAPSVGKLLQALTVYGVFDAMQGAGLQFSELVLPFRYAGDVLELLEARAYSASLGLTGQGRIDLARRQIDMTGTVVPAYVLNSMLGRIPVIGRLFSPEKGGGLVAMNYTIRGALADPAVTVNPLSALTPGFLRGLFKIFD